MASKSLAPTADDAANPGRQDKGNPVRRYEPKYDLKPGVTLIEPDSREWKSCGMQSRLEGLPHLETLLKDGTAGLMLCDRKTHTAMDAAAIFGFHADQIVKSIYAEARNRTDHYMVVCIGTEAIPLSKLLARHVAGLRLNLSWDLPPGMMPGTCTPFMPQSVAESIRMIAVEDPNFVPGPYSGMYGGRNRKPIGDNIVDVSIGGTDDLALRLSVHMLYYDLVASLEKAYGDRIRLLDYIHR
jgi:hypothetical protein